MATTLREIEWYESYELGFKELDDDHHRLVDIANDIIGALHDKQFDQCARLTGDFIDTLKQHFPREENFLKEIGYPQLKEHADNHQRLLARAEEFVQLCDTEKEMDALTEHFSKIVTYTLADMRGADLDFRTHLVEKGINKEVP